LNCVSDLRRVLGVAREELKTARSVKARYKSGKQKTRALRRPAEVCQFEDRHYAPLAQNEEIFSWKREKRCRPPMK
jgi:hypothetical protein